MISPKPKRPTPMILTVKTARYLTPNMIRVTLTGPELADVAPNCAGANCKILIPHIGQDRRSFEREVQTPATLARRTYTVRAARPDLQELDIDFVAHGDTGPASAWAMAADKGDFLGFSGPSALKISDYYADWYLVAADMSALPVAAATLEAMPRNAKGVAIFEIQTPEDQQQIDMPDGIKAHWIILSDPHHRSTAQERFIASMDWPTGTCQTCIAGESLTIRSIRAYLTDHSPIERKDMYISGYWKIGLIEDEHQAWRKAQPV